MSRHGRRDRSRPGADDLATLHHPVRRRMLEFLNLNGPSTVGAIAAGLGQQVGSVSHHMKTLERAGFVEPAPELAADRRESWWRGVPRRMSWSITDFAESPGELLLATAAERANLQHHADKVSAWLSDQRGATTPVWLDAAFATEIWATATAEEMTDLAERGSRSCWAIWADECREHASRRGRARRPRVRTPVFVFTARQPGPTVSEGTSTAVGESPGSRPPPLRRDRRVHAWVAATGSVGCGDTVWLVALAWTAVHVAGPAQAGLLVGIGTLPRAALMLVGGALADRWDTARARCIAANAARSSCCWPAYWPSTLVDGHTFAVLAGVALALRGRRRAAQPGVLDDAAPDGAARRHPAADARCSRR